MQKRCIILLAVFFSITGPFPLVVFPRLSADEPAAAFRPLPVQDSIDQLTAWLASADHDRQQAALALQKWADRNVISAMSAEDRLDLLIQSFAAVNPQVSESLQTTQAAGMEMSVDFEGSNSAAFFRQHVLLWQGRHLTQHRHYEDALEILNRVSPEGLIDPASLFFYRAACRLHLLQNAEASSDLTLLLKRTVDIPERFRTVAEMMLQQAGPQPEGIDLVAGLMTDVQRRLDIGRTNEGVQKREEEVVAALDKLLEDLDQQQQQQQQQQNGGGQNTPGNRAAQQNMIKGSAGEGEADSRELTKNGAWGMLDERQETQARELIRQQFPPNFLDAISRYTRKIAEQKE